MYAIYWKRFGAIALIGLSNLFVMAVFAAQTQAGTVARLAAGTIVNSDIVTNTTWTVSGSPYTLSGMIRVSKTITLTVEPGVTVIGGNGAFQIAGNLNAIGAPAQPIAFSGGSPSALHFLDGGTGVLQHIDMQFHYGIGLYEDSGSVQISDSILQNANGIPLGTDAASYHQLQLSNVTIMNNGENLIEIAGISNQLQEDAILSGQPGLEGYVVYGEATSGGFKVPAGITLTIEPDLTLFLPHEMSVLGNFQAIGTPTHPITLASYYPTSRIDLLRFEAGGSGTLQYAAYQLGNGLNLESSSSLVQIFDTVFSTVQDAPLVINFDVLHQLQMANVSFLNNSFSHIEVSNKENETNISMQESATLSSFPGLISYFLDLDSGESASNHAFRVPAGITLTLNPSVTIHSHSDRSIRIEGGHLQANGTPTMPVTLSTFPGIPTAYNWQGIELKTGTTDLAYTRVLSAGSGISITNGIAKLNCVSVAGNNQGIWIDGSGTGNLEITNGLFAGNSIAGLQNDHADQIDARYSWWGDASGPSGIGVGAGDVISGNVSYDPWLTAPVCTYITPQTLDQSTITLDWQPHQNSCGYQVYRSTTPYFSPPAEGTLLANLPASTTNYHDPDSDADDYFYHVLTQVCAGGEMPANETGIFHFPIVPRVS